MQKNTAVKVQQQEGPVVIFNRPPTDDIVEDNRQFDCAFYHDCVDQVAKIKDAEGFTCDGCTRYTTGKDEIERSTLFDLEEPYTLEEVPLKKIVMNFDMEEKSFKDLAGSVNAIGVLQPVILLHDKDSYMVYAGKRRILSAKKKGMESISAKVFRKGTPESLLTVFALAENMNRSPNPADETRNLQKVMHDYGWTAEEASKKLSIAVPHIRDRLKLLQLIPEFFERLKTGTLKVSMAKKICQLPEEKQKELLSINKLTLQDITQSCRDYKLDNLISQDDLFVVPAQREDVLQEAKTKLVSYVASIAGVSDTKSIQKAIKLIEQQQVKGGGQ